MISLSDMFDRSTPPPIQSVPFAFRKPTRMVLANNVPLYIIKASGQEVVRVDFVFAAGKWHQTQKLQAVFTNRMLREGCRGYSSSDLAERLDYYGAWLELSVAMNRTFVTLYTLKKFFSYTISLVQRMLFEPTFPETQFQTIRANNKVQFMVNMQKGDVLAMRALRRSIYGPFHPCGMQVEEEDYDALQLANLIDYFHRHYGSRTCSIYLSGSVDDVVVKQVESLFGSFEWGNGIPCGSEGFEICPDGETSNIIKLTSVVQSSIRMGTLLMDVNDEDYLPMRVLNTTLGGYFGSRLMKNIREEKGYTYHISSDLVTNTSQALFLISCDCLADKSTEVIDEVHREMYRLQTELVPEEELRMIRNYMMGELCRNYEGAFSLADAYIYMEHLGLPSTYIEKTMEAIDSTDSVRLQQLAQNYLRPELLHAIVVCP